MKQAVAAVTAIKPSLVGLRTDKFPHAYRNVVTLREACVVAETADQVQVQLKASDGTEAGKASTSRLSALHTAGARAARD